MARHRRSKKTKVQVNPNATINYVTGIVTGANNYVMGLLTGANMYQHWAEVEYNRLNGLELAPYKKDAVKKFLQKHPDAVQRIQKIAEAVLSGKELSPADAQFLTELKKETNYSRLLVVDQQMIFAGNDYRKTYAEYYQSRNPNTGLMLLETYANFMPKDVQYRLGNIISSKVAVR